MEAPIKRGERYSIVAVDELSMIVGAVLSQTTGLGFKVAGTPIEARRQEWEERIKSRLKRTRFAADRAAGDRVLDPSDRVAHKAFIEAAFNDDELMADYLGGVIAASGPTDDRGSTVVAQIGRLSARQLRLHYIIYRAVHQLWPRNAAPVNLYNEAHTPRLMLRTATDLLPALGESGMDVATDIYVLHRENLIHGRWDHKIHEAGDPVFHALSIAASASGAELFLWGHGVPPCSGYANLILEPDLELQLLTDVPPTPTASFSVPPKLQTTSPVRLSARDASADGSDLRHRRGTVAGYASESEDRNR